MSEIFKLRSFVGNQVDKLSSPKNMLVDKFRQTVDTIKLPFSNTNQTERETSFTPASTTNNDAGFVLRPSGSSSSSSDSSATEPTVNTTASSSPFHTGNLLVSLLPASRSSHSSSARSIPPSTPPTSQQQSAPHSPSPTSPKLFSNIKTLTDRWSRRASFLRRHVSESNHVDERLIVNTEDTSQSQPIYHNHPPIDVNFSPTSLTSDTNHTKGINLHPTTTTITMLGPNRSRSLIRQSTDTTCTFPIRRTIRRMDSIETVEIPGLNGVKALRYLHDNLGKLQPDLYKIPISNIEPSYGCGNLTFNFFYNPTLTALIVTVISMDNLPWRDVNAKTPPDPFVKLNLLPDRRRKFQSKVYKRTINPQINETFQFVVNRDELRKRILLLAIYDFGRSTKRSLIGMVKVDELDKMLELTTGEIVCTRCIVPGTESDPDLGELTVSLCYLPNAKRVTVTVVKASALKPMDITGKSDPYVKVILLVHGKKVRKKKTSVLSNTLNPTYNESLEFDVTLESIEDADLIFKVIDYDLVGANELIGCVGIGAHFEGINREHWFQMLEHPRQPITESYSLRESIPPLPCRSPTVTHKTLT